MEEEKKGEGDQHVSKFDKLHSQVDEAVKEQWEKEQNELKLKLVESDSFDWVLDLESPDHTTLKLVRMIRLISMIGSCYRYIIFKER